MATTIAPVTGTTHINHALLIDLTLGGTTYYISGAYKPVTFDGNTYTELGSFLSISDIAEDIKTTNGDITVALSGIPSEQDYIALVLGTKIKGGNIKIYRAFFDDDGGFTTSNVFQRYSGVITNFAISEEVDVLAGKNTNTVGITCASINTVLKQRITGQRTNEVDRNRFFAGDTTFNRCKDLHNMNFDFGKEYTGGTGIGGGRGRGRGGGGYGGGGYAGIAPGMGFLGHF